METTVGNITTKSRAIIYIGCNKAWISWKFFNRSWLSVRFILQPWYLLIYIRTSYILFRKYKRSSSYIIRSLPKWYLSLYVSCRNLWTKGNGTTRHFISSLSFEYSRLSFNQKIYPNLKALNIFSFSFIVAGRKSWMILL